MFDINTIVNAAINAAVQEAMEGHITNAIVLAQRCAALEKTLDDTIGELDTLKQRVKALENIAAEYRPTMPSDEAKMVEALNSQEWFWEKLTSKAKEVADAAAEEAIEDHCTNYDHDDYDRTSSAVDDLDLDGLVSRGGLQDTVRDILSDATIRFRF